eukprot:TRINITY_DN19902_c0_g1_i1.p1 TRINITY_DN19902_c0_g1~~TRINITY_DN19902_c0_g1_i1.p1  ORF type:complete len:218 (-),score=52.73 TRINITY_DN19902_c0_g1_i1:57-710(-)
MRLTLQTRLFSSLKESSVVADFQLQIKAIWIVDQDPKDVRARLTKEIEEKMERQYSTKLLNSPIDTTATVPLLGRHRFSGRMLKSTIEKSGSFSFTVQGASTDWGRGALITATIDLIAGNVLYFLVGGTETGGGGAGGSFIMLHQKPLLVAGGAGGGKSNECNRKVPELKKSYVDVDPKKPKFNFGGKKKPGKKDPYSHADVDAKRKKRDADADLNA